MSQTSSILAIFIITLTIKFLLTIFILFCFHSDSTCSRSSCSICSDSVSEKDESYSDSTDSEESYRKQKVHAKSSSKRKYSKSSKSKIPPLPVIYDPILKNGKMMSMPYSHVTDKTEMNLMSTSFNLPNSNASSNSYTPIPIQSTNPNSFSTHVPNTWSQSCNLSTVNNVLPSTKNSDVLVTSLKNISLTDELNITEQSINNLPKEDISNSYKVVDHATSAFSGALNPESMDAVPNYSLDNSSHNFMSTSFTNQPLGDKLNGFKNSKAGKTNESMSSYLKHVSEHADENVISVEPVISKCNNFPLHPILESPNDLMSTSFNNPEDFSDGAQNQCDNASESQVLKRKHNKMNIPAPPSRNDNSTNFNQEFLKKNYVAAENVIGLSAIDTPMSKIQHMKASHNASNLLQQQNRISNTLQNPQQSSNLQSACKYRLDYDFDYVPLHSTSENLNTTDANQPLIKSDNHNISKYQNKPLKVELSKNVKSINLSRDKKLLSNVPPLPVISSKPIDNEKFSSATASTDAASNNVTEKPKVKFSDTVTHILVPNTVSNLKFN